MRKEIRVPEASAGRRIETQSLLLKSVEQICLPRPTLDALFTLRTFVLTCRPPPSLPHASTPQSTKKKIEAILLLSLPTPDAIAYHRLGPLASMLLPRLTPLRVTLVPCPPAIAYHPCPVMPLPCLVAP
ncbi:hypothetical protein SORBI_3001G290900 [Sorghum bicolor]|uniref:Uncharacterized protein n=1 Tax=Sorghum bicolor TaxID=4558 RepID=A0A1B6QLS5_SORBI|nr:hypothetical protein SORBI_3001G290900 [Sorghum bicolor]